MSGLSEVDGAVCIASPYGYAVAVRTMEAWAGPTFKPIIGLIARMPRARFHRVKLPDLRLRRARPVSLHETGRMLCRNARTKLDDMGSTKPLLFRRSSIQVQT